MLELAIDPAMGAQKRRTDLGDQFLRCIGIVTKSFSQFTVTPTLSGSPMGMFMGQRGVVRETVPERLKRRHLDMVTRERIERLIPTMANISAYSAKECFSVCDALRG